MRVWKYLKNSDLKMSLHLNPLRWEVYQIYLGKPDERDPGMYWAFIRLLFVSFTIVIFDGGSDVEN